MYKNCYARVILHNVGEIYILEHECHISALTHAWALVLSESILLLSMSTNFNYCHT